MGTSISAGDLTLLREQQNTHYTIERLYGFGSPTAWQGRVNNASIARGVQTIVYDSGSMATNFAFSDLQAGMLVFLGSSAGASDLGRRRLLSISGTATSGTIIVDWHDDIELSDDDHITIIHHFPPWPKYSWFTSTGPDFRKDGPPSSEGGAGIDYSDQNETPPPLVIMGRNYAGQTQKDADKWWRTTTIVDGDVVAVYQPVGAYSLADSYVNLANPGTNHAAPGTAPTWAASSGWTFNGSTQYLTTGITPTANYTIIVRFASSSTVTGSLAGEQALNANFRISLTSAVLAGLIRISYTWHWAAGTQSAASIPYTIGKDDIIAALASNQPYYTTNSDVLTAPSAISSTFSGSPDTLYIGASNNSGASDFFNSSILAVAIYNRQLTQAEVSTITTAMRALTSSSNPTVITLDATDSVAVATGASISSYAWSFTPSSAAGFIPNSTSGQTYFYPTINQRYWVHCTVTDDNANASIGHRAFITDDPDNTIAITEFSRSGITSQYDRHEITCQLTLTSPDTSSSTAIRPQVDWSDFTDLGLIIITAEDYYGTTQKTISFRNDSAYTDRQHIVFSGYLLLENDDLVEDGTGAVQVTAVSTMDMFLYSLSLTGVSDASDWYEMNSDLMTVAGNLFHLFYYHSTLLDISDWWLPWTDTVKRSANEEFTQGSLLEKAKALCRARLMGMTATPQGEIFVETDLNLRSASDRSSETTTLTLAETDLTGSKRVRTRQRGDVVRVLVSGGSSTGILGSFTPFLTASQEVARAEGRPQIQSFDKLMLPDETEAQRIAGRLGGVLNRKYIEVNLQFSGNYREVLSPADQQWVNLGSVFGSSLIANLRGYTDLESSLVVPRQVTHNFDNASGYTTISLVADIQAPVELNGVTLPTQVVPSENPEDGEYDLPDAPKWPTVPDNETVAGAAVGLDATSGVYWTLDSGGTWTQRNGGLAATGGAYLIWSPWWKTPEESNSGNPENVVLWWTGDGFIRKSTDAGKTWSDITQYLTTPPNGFSDSPAPGTTDLTYLQIHGDIHRFGVYLFIAEWDSGSSVYRSWLLKTTDNGAVSWTWAQLS